MPFPHEFNQRIIDLLRMRGTQKVLAILDGHEFRGRRIGKELNLLLCVGDGIGCVIRTLDAKFGISIQRSITIS